MRKLIFILLLPLFGTLQAQTYPFIRYKENKLQYADRSENLAKFFDRWQRMESSRLGNINIVHIGGSHVQAGSMSNAIRQHLMHDHPHLVSGRGLLFPYSAAARCNNPADYRVHCPQVGIVLRDSTIDYATSRIIVLGHSEQGVVPLLNLDGRIVHPSYVDRRTDRHVFNLNSVVDSFVVLLPCRTGEQFILTGLHLDNLRPGISFHSIGVNGASVPDYLRCEHFTRDLRLLRPDMVIFGLGINDASKSDFDTADFRRNYLALVDSVLRVNPDCALVFITNNDSYTKVSRKKYKVNAKGTLAREVFLRVARETGGVVWDQFMLMGGLGSMEQWQKAKLAQADRVHFTRTGYQLLGDLFYEALLNAYRRSSRKK